MLQAGKLITQANDPLQKVQPEYLYHAVRNPKPEIAAAIRQLRLVRTIDETRYQHLKKQLPYVTCGIFNPGFRRTENFAWANHFIIDIDHISEKQLEIRTLKDTLCKDARVKLLFYSPGEDGLKILMPLADKCFDLAQYSLFYRLFVRSFSVQYGLEQVCDKKTSDVTRACFVSYDADAYFNPDTQPVEMSEFINLNSPFEMAGQLRDLKKDEADNPYNGTTAAKQKDPDIEAMEAIKNRLNPNRKKVHEKLIYVPKELDETVPTIIITMQDNQIETEEVSNINYGRKFRFRLGTKRAELDIYYGKRGYTIVKSPRTWASPEFSDICQGLMQELLLS